MVYGIPPLSELPLSNDFMFGQVMRQKEVCKLFLEALLGKEIARIEYIDRQEDLADDYAGHGIRLDIFLSDADRTHYDIEMQKTNQRHLERRIRYYQSGIDRRILGKNMEYEALPESYVIFICDFDYYRRGLACYERVSGIKGVEDILYDDGSHAVLLNSRYTEGNADRAILEFLDYIRTNDAASPETTELARRIKESVYTVRHDKTKEVPYMTYAMKMRDARREGWLEGQQEGRLEGRKEGRLEGRLEGRKEGRLEGRKEGQLEERRRLMRRMADTLPPEEIARCLRLPLEEVLQALEGPEAQ